MNQTQPFKPAPLTRLENASRILRSAGLSLPGTRTDEKPIVSLLREVAPLGEAKTDIAETLGISRFKVARLIDLALGAGIVQISITPPDSLDTETSARLRDRLGLEHVLVAPGPTPAGAPAEACDLIIRLRDAAAF